MDTRDKLYYLDHIYLEVVQSDNHLVDIRRTNRGNSDRLYSLDRIFLGQVRLGNRLGDKSHTIQGKDLHIYQAVVLSDIPLGDRLHTSLGIRDFRDIYSRGHKFQVVGNRGIHLLGIFRTSQDKWVILDNRPDLLVKVLLEMMSLLYFHKYLHRFAHIPLQLEVDTSLMALLLFLDMLLVPVWYMAP